MKTLLLAPELFTTDSGIPRILRLYLKALCELACKGDRVRFVALNDGMIDSTTLRPYSSSAALSGWEVCNRSKLRFIRSTLRLSARTRLIVCGHVAQLPVAWVASLIRPKLRYVLVAHGIEVWRPFGFWERRALLGAWKIFCVSEFTRTELLARVRLDPARVVVVPNALDPVLNAVNSIPPIPLADEPVILAVARLSAADSYKGIDHLILALPEILKTTPDARLRIVGRGDDLPRLKSLAKEHQVGHAVEFTGFVNDQQLRREFARCRVFALPSQKEGFGLVYLEAMAHGKPCIAALAGGAPEVITPESGLLVPYGDVPALAEACTRALCATWDADAIRACARRFSYSTFRDNVARHLSAP